MIKKIKTRDGRIIPFNERTIDDAIMKANLDAHKNYPDDVEYIPDKLLDIYVDEISEKFNNRIPSVDQI